MDESKEIVERLRGLELVGGSHQMLAAIGAAVLPTHHGWTSGACRALRDRLVELVEDGEGYARGYSAGYDMGSDSKKADMEELLGDGYAALPLDADGKPVHVGDWVRDLNEDEPYGVAELRLDRYGWTALSDDGDRYVPTQCRHYKPDSIENVVRDALDGRTTEDEAVARIRAIYGEES